MNALCATNVPPVSCVLPAVALARPVPALLLAAAIAITLLLAVTFRLRRRAATPPRTRPSWIDNMAPRRRKPAAPIAVWPSTQHPGLLVAPPTPATKSPADNSPSDPADTSPANANNASRPTVAVLGPLTIDGGKQTRHGLRAAALELVAYLALHPHGATRDQLLEALWPDTDPKRSRQRLYQTTRDARRLLGNALQNNHDRYTLDRTQVQVDADDLHNLFTQADQASSEQERNEFLERALTLFRAEPLAGSDYPWAEGTLRRLRATHVHLLEQVGYIRLQSGNARTALDAAEHGLTIDQLNEAFWRLAIEAESQLGLREALSRRYERLQRALNEQLGLEPAQETRALYRRLLGQN